MADSPTRRRGKKSLLIRRDATLRISGALHLDIFEQPAENDFFSNLLIGGVENRFGTARKHEAPKGVALGIVILLRNVFASAFLDHVA